MATRTRRWRQIYEKDFGKQEQGFGARSVRHAIQRRDYAAAEKYWSPDYIQHSAHIGPGCEGLFNLVKILPPTLKYEPGTIVADGDVIIVHGRFSGFQSVSWIAADILRVEDGAFVEHWDVIQDEATKGQSKSGRPMFGDKFPKEGE